MTDTQNPTSTTELGIKPYTRDNERILQAAIALMDGRTVHAREFTRLLYIVQTARDVINGVPGSWEELEQRLGGPDA